MKFECIWTGKNMIAHKGDKVGPFEVFEAGPRWCEAHLNHRLKTIYTYNDELEEMGHQELVEHGKLRRERTGEDLNLNLPQDELLERLKYDEPE